MFQLGLVGYPVKHSLSPWIHEQFLKVTQLTGMYNLYEINPIKQTFKKEIEQIKERTDGFNVTLPYKQSIIPFLDILDETAQQSGAVNTVVRQHGKWIGFNTDGIGYVRSLKIEYPHLFSSNDIKVLIIGAGGASRGIYYALINEGFSSIDITNRTIEKAMHIVEDSCAETNIYCLEQIQKVLDTYDLIIQTTSVGMKPNEHEFILPVNKLKGGAVVSDIVYQPIFTSFLQQAKAKGALIHYGHTMLLYQALYAFEIWTNKQISIHKLDLRNKLTDILKGK